MSLRRFHALLVLAAIATSLASAQGSIDTELRVAYPKAPKKLETDPAVSSVVLVDFDFHGIIQLNNLEGTALLGQQQDGALFRARTMKGRLVMFHDLEPGTYSLEFIKLANYNADLVLQAPAADKIDVTVVKGEVAYLGTVVVTKKFGPDLPVIQLTYDAKREIEAWSKFKEKYAGSPWTAVADRRIASLQSPAKPQDQPRAGGAEQDDPLKGLVGDWDLTAFVIGPDQFGGPRCGKADRPGPSAVTIAPPAENAVSLAVPCDDGSDYAFRLKYDPAVRGYHLTVKSKVGISIDDFPVTFVADHGWQAEGDASVGNGGKVPIRASVSPIEGKNWYGWAIVVLPTAEVDRPSEELETPYFRADLTRRK